MLKHASYGNKLETHWKSQTNNIDLPHQYMGNTFLALVLLELLTPGSCTISCDSNIFGKRIYVCISKY